MCGYLFDINEYESGNPDESAIDKKLKGHVWTERKAQLIARYLQAFTYVTKHGTYIDAFAGPQTGEKYDNWAAKLVLENEPKWLRRFHLFELKEASACLLDSLKEEHHEEGDQKKLRKVNVYRGDTNQELPRFLSENPIPQKEASFCLLDQRTKECDWATVKVVAEHKQQGNKIEIFYFLAQGWVDRVLTDKLGEGNVDNLESWLGEENWKDFKRMNTHGRAKYFTRRFEQELGYKFCTAYPIYEHGTEGRIMFWMIHGSDHERAKPLMDTAYRSVGGQLPESEYLEQLVIKWEEI